MTVCLLVSLILPQIVQGATSNYSAELGTNKALGSPLLSSTFEADDWNPYEMICFGVFLSNYCTKFGYDNYETAFSKTSKSGSKGKAYDALVFGTGTANEETAKKALDTMLNYAINRQKATGKAIYRRTRIVTHTDTGDKSYTGGDTKAQARFMDMMVLPADKKGVSKLKDKTVTATVIGNNIPSIMGLTGLNYVYGTGYVGYEFYIMGENNQPITVFNSLDAWDMQQLVSYMTALTSYDMDFSYLQSYMEENGSLELDAFGNICVKTGTTKKIILPAACNQYLTDTPSYNFITTATVNSSYSHATTNNILRYMAFSEESSKIYKPNAKYVVDLISSANVGLTGDSKTVLESVASSAGQQDYAYDIGMVKTNANNNNLRDGQHMYALDTNTYLGEYLTKNGYKTHSSSINDWGLGIVNILNSKLTGEASLGCGFTSLTIGENLVNQGLFETLFNTAKHKYLVNNLAISLNTISNSIPVNKARKRLTGIQMSSGEQSIFGKPVYVAANITPTDTNYPLRVAINDMFRYLDGTTTKNNPNITDLPSASVIVNNLRTAKTAKEVENVLFCGTTTNSTASALFRNALISNTAIDTTEAIDTLSQNNIGLDTALSECKIKSVSGTILSNSAANCFSAENREKAVTRIVKVYPRSDVLIKLCNNFNETASTDDFGALTPYIYLTYYEWYGITGTTGNRFNGQIFPKTDDILSTTGEDLFSNTFQTSKDKEKSVLNYAYLLLNPTDADSKEYKTSLFDNVITGTMYNQYLKLTESNSSDLQLGGSSIKTKTSGFLNVPTLSENWVTSLFTLNYSKIAILLLGCCLLAVILIGIVTHKGWAWYLVSVITVINILILTPAISEINPYICNRVVQSVFAKHSDYWAIAEDISNLQQEQEAVKASLNTDSEVLSDQTLASLVRDLSLVYLDSSIQIKSDISRKVIEDTNDTISNMQNTLAARWLLPVLMRQSTGDSGTMDYVYTSLLDMYNNQQNIYWYYRPEALNDSKTLNAKSVTKKDTTDRGADIITDTNYKLSQYSKYLKVDDLGSLWKNENDKDTYTLSLTRTLDDEYKTHAGYYLVDFNTLNELGTGCTPENLDLAGLREAEAKMEKLASEYQSSEGAEQCFGFLETTENPSLYFYMLVRDMCDGQLFETDKIESTITPGTTQEVSSSSVASIVANLQGKTIKLVDVSENIDGSEYKELNTMTSAERAVYSAKELENRTKTVRVSFMHTGKTGYIRDFADTEELFTNVIPYLYDMYVISRGTGTDSNGNTVYRLSDLSDGTANTSTEQYNALFQEDEKMTDFALYKDNDKSWFWRSNWAIKLLEDSDLNRERTAYKRDNGKRVAVSLTGTPMNPRSYPTDRPMVFSEAQMQIQGLKESDLTLPELKVLKFNKALERKWTLLLNYANVNGMSPEIMYRQMALSATLEFNKAFDTGRGFNGSKTLYPQSLDLRNISYDNVLRLILLNTTGNTAYLQTSPVKALFQSGSFLTHLTVLASAFGSEFVMPLFRNLFIGYLMVLAVIMTLKHIISPVQAKVRLSTGYILSNIVFIGLNIIYFMMFKLLIATTTPDEVLTIGNLNTASGSPTMITFLIFLADIVYCVYTVKLGYAVFKYRNDMGFGMYVSKLGEVTAGIRGFISKATGWVTGNKTTENTAQSTGTDTGTSADIDSRVTGTVKIDPNTDTDETVYNDDIYREDSTTGMPDDTQATDGKSGIDFKTAVEQGRNNLENKQTAKSQPKTQDTNPRDSTPRSYDISDYLSRFDEPSKDRAIDDRDVYK